MVYTATEEKLINMYVDLVRAGRRTLESIPTKYREEVEAKIIEKDMAVIEETAGEGA